MRESHSRRNAPAPLSLRHELNPPLSADELRAWAVARLRHHLLPIAEVLDALDDDRHEVAASRIDRALDLLDEAIRELESA